MFSNKFRRKALSLKFPGDICAAHSHNFESQISSSNDRMTVIFAELLNANEPN
jgi:hypothetical protein